MVGRSQQQQQLHLVRIHHTPITLEQNLCLACRQSGNSGREIHKYTITRTDIEYESTYTQTLTHSHTHIHRQSYAAPAPTVGSNCVESPNHIYIYMYIEYMCVSYPRIFNVYVLSMHETYTANRIRTEQKREKFLCLTGQFRKLRSDKFVISSHLFHLISMNPQFKCLSRKFLAFFNGI